MAEERTQMITCERCGFKGAESEFIIDTDINGDQEAICGTCNHATPLEDPAFRVGGEFYGTD